MREPEFASSRTSLTLADLKPGDHACWLYQTDETHQAVLTPFLRLGLERGEKIIYGVDGHAADRVLAYLAQDGLEVGPFLSSGQLVFVTLPDVYDQHGGLDSEALIAPLQAEVERARAQGYSALRVTGEMTWVFHRLSDLDRLIEYEAKLNQLFAEGHCLSICQYDLRRFDPQVLLNVLRSHPLVISGTQVYENVYYIPPAALLGEERAENDLHHWLDTLAEQRRSQEALRESEGKYRALVEQSLQGLTIVQGAPLQPVFINTPGAEMLGYTVEELLSLSSKDLLSLIYPEDREQALALLRQRLAGEPVSPRRELRVVRKDGAVRWVETLASRIQYQGAPAVQASLIDITERQQAEQALRESEEMYKTLVRTLPDSVTVTDLEGDIIEVSRRALELHGVDKVKDLAAKNAFDLIAPQDRPRALENMQKTLEQGFLRNARYTLLRQDGTSFAGELNAALVRDDEGKPKSFIATVRDVTQQVQLEQQLEERRLYLESVLACAPDAIVTLDAQHRVLEWNRGAENLFGYVPEEAIGRDIDGLIAAPDPEIFEEATRFTRQALAQGTIQPQETVRYRRDGTPVNVIVAGAPILIRGELVGVVAVYTDITKRKRAEQELARRLAQTQALREVMVAAASTLDFDQVLERACEMLETTMQVDFLSVVLPDKKGEGLKVHPSLIGYSPAVVDTVLPLKGSVCGQVFRTGEPLLIGDVRQVSYYYDAAEGVNSELAVPVRVGGRVIGVLNVESRRLNAFDEEDLAFYTAIAGQLGVALENARLYQEVSRQAKELARVVDQLQELDRLKNEFIQTVSHELRTPLALIMGYAELLQSGDLGGVQPEQQQPVSVIVRRSRTLATLVQDISLVLELESGPPNPLPVRLDQVLRAAIADLKGEFERAELRLQADVPADLAPVPGFPDYVRRVVDGLLSNALKFTPAGGSVAVRLGQQGEQVWLSVRDTGIGIPPDQHDEIFDRFYQVDGSVKRRYGGVGLGLALVKQIVELYGGSVGVESQPGQGSTFTVRLPVYRGGDVT